MGEPERFNSRTGTPIAEEVRLAFLRYRARRLSCRYATAEKDGVLRSTCNFAWYFEEHPSWDRKGVWYAETETGTYRYEGRTG